MELSPALSCLPLVQDKTQCPFLAYSHANEFCVVPGLGTGGMQQPAWKLLLASGETDS
jgi:hypothetical protein